MLVFPGVAFAGGDLRRARAPRAAGRRRPRLALVRRDSGGTRARPAAPAALARARADGRRHRPDAASRGARLGPRPRAGSGRGDLRRACSGARRGRRGPSARAPRHGLLDVGFAAVMLVDEEETTATGLYAELTGSRRTGGEEMQRRPRNEPSGIASAVSDARAGDGVRHRQLVARQQAARRAGRREERYLRADDRRVERVLGVLSSRRPPKRTFVAQTSSRVLQAVAAEAALALERLRSAAALADALAASIAAQIARRCGPSSTLDAWPTSPRRSSAARSTRPCRRRSGRRAARRLDVEARGTASRPSVERDALAGRRRLLLVDTVARELDSALHTARLLDENKPTARPAAGAAARRAGRHQRAVARSRPAAARPGGDDAPRCRRGPLLSGRSPSGACCAALRSTGSTPRPFSARVRPGQRRDSGRPRPAAPPMTVLHGPRCADGLGGRDARSPRRRRARSGDALLGGDDVELLEAFASLAALALRNAESFEASGRVKPGSQRGFSRVASLLGEPLSLAETYDAAAQAAADALGGDFAAVLGRRPAGSRLAGGHAAARGGTVARTPARARGRGARGALLRRADLRDDRFDGSWRAAPFASLLAIPVGGETPGLVLVFFVEERDFARDDLELAHQVAAAATGALDRSRLFEAERSCAFAFPAACPHGELARDRARPGCCARSCGPRGREPARRRRCGARSSSKAKSSSSSPRTGTEAEQALGARSPATGWRRRRRCAVPRAGRPRGPASNEGLAESDALLSLGHRGYLGVPLAGRRGCSGRRSLRLLPATATVAGGRDSRRLRHSPRTAPSRCRTPSSTSMSRSNVSRTSRSSRTSPTASLPSIVRGMSSSGTAPQRRSPACLRPRRSVARLLRCCGGTCGRITPARAARSQS